MTRQHERRRNKEARLAYSRNRRSLVRRPKPTTVQAALISLLAALLTFAIVRSWMP